MSKKPLSPCKLNCISIMEKIKKKKNKKEPELQIYSEKYSKINKSNRLRIPTHAHLHTQFVHSITLLYKVIFLMRAI